MESWEQRVVTESCEWRVVRRDLRTGDSSFPDGDHDSWLVKL